MNKKCRKCFKQKKLTDFYSYNGKPRGECKQCTIKNNVAYQKRTEAWKHRFLDDEKTKPYMKEYYSKNKEKFAGYRTKFREKNPQYYREYLMKKRNPGDSYGVDC